jgi:hypothetical protein
MNLKENESAIESELERLEARRRVLSFQVGRGDEAAEIELDGIEDQIGRLKRDMERRALAAIEAQLQADAEAERQREIQRRAQLAQLKAARSAMHVAATEVDAATDMLTKAITGFLAAGNEVYALSGGRAKSTGRSQLEAYLTWQIGTVLERFAGLPMPIRELRRPLAKTFPPPEDAE